MKTNKIFMAGALAFSMVLSGGMLYRELKVKENNWQESQGF